jgi:uncharacterized protein YegP (UPF0339 family)
LAALHYDPQPLPPDRLERLRGVLCVVLVERSDMKLEIYEARRGLALRKQWRWRVRAANGRIISMSSEGYNNRADLMRGIEITAQAIRQGQPGARA